MSRSLSDQFPLLLLLLLLAGCSQCSSSHSGMREDIDEETWPEVLSGGRRWFIQFYAPWCDACQSLAPTWQSLAASEALPRDVSIGQVDVTRNEGLAGMFLVTGLPSLYILHDGQFWQYRGERSLPALLRHIQLAEYARLPPLPRYRAPDAAHMRALGRLIQAAVRLKRLHTHLVEARGLPSWLAYLALALLTLAVGLLLGLCLVCLCDLLAAGCRRRSRRSAADSLGDRPAGEKADAASAAAAVEAESDGKGDNDDGEEAGMEDGVGDGDSEDLAAESKSDVAPRDSDDDVAVGDGEREVRKRRGVRKETS